MKNKKKLKRIAVSLLCVVLSFCVFAFPVSAASSTWSEYHTTLSGLFPDGFDASNYELDMLLDYITDAGSYTLEPEEVHGDYGIQYRLPVISNTGDFYLRGRWRGLDLSVSAGDSFSISTWLYGWSNRDYFSNKLDVKFIVYVNAPDADMDDEVLHTDWIALPLNADYNFSSNIATSVNIGMSGVVDRIEIVFKGYRRIAEQGRFRYWLRGGVTFGYGNPSAPNAPSYSKPDEGDLGALEEKEQELESNTAEGRQEVQEIISPDSLTSNLLSYAKGLQFTSRIMLSAITKIPFLNALVWVSMSLGFVATLFALSASIIAASDRRAGATARAGKHSRR